MVKQVVTLQPVKDHNRADTHTAAHAENSDVNIFREIITHKAVFLK